MRWLLEFVNMHTQGTGQCMDKHDETGVNLHIHRQSDVVIKYQLAYIGFVLWSLQSWFKTGKVWTGRPGNGGLWRISLSGNCCCAITLFNWNFRSMTLMMRALTEGQNRTGWWKSTLHWCQLSPHLYFMLDTLYFYCYTYFCKDTCPKAN